MLSDPIFEKFHAERYFLHHFHYRRAGIRLGALTTMTGHELRRSPEYAWDGMKRLDHGIILWQFTLDGAGSLCFEQDKHRILPGEAMLIEVPHQHLYKVDREAGKWDFVFMILRGSETLRLGREVIRRNGPVLRYRDGAQSLASARRMLAWPESGIEPLEMSIASYRFILELHDEFARETESVKAAPGLLVARRRALSDFSHGISVAELAEIAGMSYAHFIREFTRVYGVSPGELLLEMQMEKALNLLRNSTVTVKETAALCGFSSCGSFCRAFRRRHGQSPGRSR